MESKAVRYELWASELKAVLLLLVLFVPGLCEAQYIRMHVGEVRVLKVDDIERVAIGRDDIVSYKPLDNGQMILIAKSPGETSLSIWRRGDRYEDHRVAVTAVDVIRQIKAVQDLASIVPGLTVRELEGSMVFEGAIPPDKVTIVEAIVGATENAVNLITVKKFVQDAMVQLDVQILEVSRNASQQLGIRWNTVAPGPAVGLNGAVVTNPRFRVFSSGLDQDIADVIPPGDKNFYGFAGITTTLGSQIELMAESGEARILASPKLITRSGEEAEFISGGEFPYQIVDALGNISIQFRPYGVILQIEPVVEDGNKILARIAAEISNIDFANQVGDVPGLLTRRADTVVNVLDGDTIVISGLASASMSEQVTKVPFFGDLPLIGFLFRSKEKVNEETELVIIVTPRLTDPASPQNQKLRAFGEKTLSGFKNLNLDSAFME